MSIMRKIRCFLMYFQLTSFSIHFFSEQNIFLEYLKNVLFKFKLCFKAFNDRLRVLIPTKPLGTRRFNGTCVNYVGYTFFFVKFHF